MRTKAAWAKLDRAQEGLGKYELFRDLQTRQLMEVAAMAEEVMLNPGEMLLEENEPARHIFVVLEGRAVAQLEMGHGCLSLGLVGDQIYPASTKALRPMRAARIDAVRLARLMEIEPAMGYSIGKRLSRLFCRQYKAALEAFKTSG